MANVNDGTLSSREDNPELLIKTYEKMIADDLKRIEEEGGPDADHLKACLYEKWVPELLDTISMLCKTTSELEQVSTNAVIQLDHKLQESASATRAFMQRSAEMDSCFYKNPLPYTSSSTASSTSLHHIFSNQNNGSCTDAEGNSLLSLQTQLAAVQQSLEESREQYQDSERTIKKLQDKLCKREVQIDSLLKNQPSGNDEENVKLKEQLAEKVAELQKILAQKKMFEKRACDREDKIKALTLEVAAKHDVVCQLEERLRQGQQRDDQHQMQLNYQGMLLEALRKELKKYKKSTQQNVQDKTSKESSTSVSNEQKLQDSTATKKTDFVTCHASECYKAQEYVKLQRRLEELEMMLRAKNDMISKMSSDTVPSRSQSVSAAALQHMTPEELKKLLFNKEKEIEEQRVLIAQLQDALVASKHKLEELQRSPETPTVTDCKDDLIKSLRSDLVEMESQYFDCFSEVCKQNQYLILLREANQHHQQMSQRLFKELQKNASNSLPEQESANTGSQLAEASCILAFAKAQLSIYKTKNVELEDKLRKINSARLVAEEQLEKLLSSYNTQLTTENEILKLAFKNNLTLDTKLTEEIISLQACINDSATLLYDKDVQIKLLQEKLNEMCDGAEKQMKLMTKRDITLADLTASLDNASKEKEVLLNKITLMESQQIIAKKNESIGMGQISKETSDRRSRKTLEEELQNLKHELKLSQQELKAWKERYSVISTNLETKEKNIELLKSEIQEQRNDCKLKEAQEHLNNLKLQLLESEEQVCILRNTCQDKEQTIALLKAELEEEMRSLEVQKAKNEEKVLEAEERVNCIQQKMEKIVSDYKEKAEDLETNYIEKEKEMQRLISISCENVEELQAAQVVLSEKLKLSEDFAAKLHQELEEIRQVNTNKLEELAEVRKELETYCSSNTNLQKQLQLAEIEVIESKERLVQFESELILSSEKVLQLQTFISQVQQERQDMSLQLSEAHSQFNSQTLTHQQQIAEITTQLQTVTVEKEHLERSQQRLEDMCKSLTAQLGGQRSERDRAVRGLRQAAAERSRLCQEARQVLSVARQWLAEHRASALEIQQLRAERDHLMTENTKLRHRRGHCTSLLNPWDCGLVDREESGFWSSHWTTQLGDHCDEEWIDEEKEEGKDGCRGVDTGYQSGGSSK